MKVVFNPNIPIFLPNSAEGLHFSAFHVYILGLDGRCNWYYFLLVCVVWCDPYFVVTGYPVMDIQSSSLAIHCLLVAVVYYLFNNSLSFGDSSVLYCLFHQITVFWWL